MSEISLGLLEFGDLNNNSYDYEGLLKYVKLADKLGFKRFWLGEHYNNNTLFTNPEPLIPYLAASTKKINIGIGGTLLKYHSPYRVASYYKLLSTIFPSRIDIGLCRTYLQKEFGTLLLGNAYEEEPSFKKKIKELTSFFNSDKLLQNPENIIPPPIAKITPPSVWVLSSSFDDMKDYRGFGLNYCRSMFHRSPIISDNENSNLRAKETSCLTSIAIAVYCSNSSSMNNIFKKHYLRKTGLREELFYCCTPSELSEIIDHLSKEIPVSEIMILNLGKSYREKKRILKLIEQQLLN